MIGFINILCENQADEDARELQNNGRCLLCLPKQINFTKSKWIFFAYAHHPCAHMAAVDSLRRQGALGVTLQKTGGQPVEGRQGDGFSRMVR